MHAVPGTRFAGEVGTEPGLLGVPRTPGVTGSLNNTVDLLGPTQGSGNPIGQAPPYGADAAADAAGSGVVGGYNNGCTIITCTDMPMPVRIGLSPPPCRDTPPKNGMTGCDLNTNFIQAAIVSLLGLPAENCIECNKKSLMHKMLNASPPVLPYTRA
jgi:hypothetical protein